MQSQKDFTPNYRALIEYKQSCDSKNKELKSDYSFVERESSFIVGETFCSPIYFFLERRPADSIDRFFLFASFSVRIGDKILLSKKKPIGINPLGNSMKKHIQQLIEQELVPNGHYTNTSLRKGLMDHLILAGSLLVLLMRAWDITQCAQEQHKQDSLRVEFQMPIHILLFSSCLLQEKRLPSFCQIPDSSGLMLKMMTPFTTCSNMYAQFVTSFAALN